MTTIAFRDNIIAADSNLAAGDTRSPPGAISKLVLGKRHKVVYAGAGRLNVLTSAIRTLEKLKALPWVGKFEQECDLDLTDDTLLVLAKQGLFVFEGVGWFRINPGFFYAAGSGETAALAAMHCGKSAVEAVEIACKMDSNSCLPVHSFSVDDLD